MYTADMHAHCLSAASISGIKYKFTLVVVRKLVSEKNLIHLVFQAHGQNMMLRSIKVEAGGAEDVLYFVCVVPLYQALICCINSYLNFICKFSV